MIIEVYEHIYVYKLTMDPKWYCSFYDSKFISYPCPLASGLQNSLLVSTVVGFLASITATFKLAAL